MRAIEWMDHGCPNLGCCLKSLTPNLTLFASIPWHSPCQLVIAPQVSEEMRDIPQGYVPTELLGTLESQALVTLGCPQSTGIYH